MNRFLCRIIAGLFSLGWAMAQVACGTAEPIAPPQPGSTEQSVKVQAVTLHAAPFDQRYEAAGTVRAQRRAVLASQLQGAVLAVHVKLGDAVRAGQLLVAIEQKELNAEVSRAEAAQAAAAEAIRQEERSLEAAAAEANLAALTLRRYQELFAKRSVSRQELDQAEARETVAQAAVETARARLAEARAQQRAEAAALEAARVRQQYATVTAPFAGVVAEKHVDAGTVAFPGMPLLTLDESVGYRLQVSLPESHRAAVKMGDRVAASIPAASLQAEGQVIEIEPAAEEGSRASLVRISLPAAAGLRSGLFGRAVFAVGKADLLTVPEQAVVRRGQLVSVFVPSKGVARRRLVTLGRKLDGGIEVLSGLTAGEQVITSGVAALTDK